MEYSWFEFSFPSPILFVKPRLKNPVCSTIPVSQEEIRWIHAFSKGIRTGETDNLVQDVNLGHRFHECPMLFALCQTSLGSVNDNKNTL